VVSTEIDVLGGDVAGSLKISTGVTGHGKPRKKDAAAGVNW
jgi:hypothetical protein